MKIEGTLQRIIANHHAGKRLEMTSIRAPACYRALGRTHLGAHAAGTPKIRCVEFFLDATHLVKFSWAWRGRSSLSTI